MTHLSPVAVATVHACVGVGMLVVVPVGIRLVGRPVPRPASRWWLVAAVFGATSVWLPVGGWAAATAVPWLAATAVLALAGLAVLVRRDRPGWPGLAVGLATPLVGALALVAERAGWGLLGYSGGYLTLTVPHMLFAGFGACLVAGLGVEDGRAARWAGWTVPVGVLLVLVGYFVGDAAELVGAVVLTVGLYGVAVATLRGLPSARLPRRLLALGAATVVASMVLALWWALGEATGLPHPGIAGMVATHGVANALGFVLATLVGLRLMRARPGLTYPEAGATRGADLPAGYRHLDERFLIGEGAATADLVTCSEDLLSWSVHRRAGVRIDGDPVARGGLVVSGLGVGPLRLQAPCQVVWVERGERRAGFAYGTLAGHPFSGEEAFLLELDDDGTLWFHVRAFSRPARWWVALAGPVALHGQRAYARRLARAVREARAPGRSDERVDDAAPKVDVGPRRLDVEA